MIKTSSTEHLFWMLFRAKVENQIDDIIQGPSDLIDKVSWVPLGGNDSNFGVIENQQSNPVAALVEKLTNSVDAILMRRCLESSINPKSTSSAPRSVEEAVDLFFPEHKNWDLNTQRNLQAQSIQVLADSQPGDTSDTSLVIYDDGEGQHPEDFEATFLSLLRGNKNEIHFVQGKYNMGGSGAIVFCGKRRYQLIASKRYDGSGLFGFTLVRKHPLTSDEAQTKKSTWYEYLKIDGKIPAFSINELDLGLLGRRFTTGTIIKLYSYELKGNRNIRRDLRRSLNEFLYAPALPIYMVENAERYPNDRALTDVVFGLKRRLQDADTYVETTFSETCIDKRIGKMKVMVHVFRTRAKDKTAAETRETIRDEFFKNRMAVLFSVNGQVHGHYTSEFITRSLKYNLMRDYLLIQVDCTEMNYDFRSELFMASRDRLKQGDESGYLRDVLAKNLIKGQLQEIYKRRKDVIAADVSDDDDLLKAFAENLPISTELRSLLSKTFKLEQDDKPKRQTPKPSTNSQEPKEQVTFHSQRFPSFFKIDTNDQGDTPVVRVPLNGEKTIRFASDIEDQYFDRTDEPGDLQVAIMKYTPNDAKGGNAAGTANDISELFNVIRRSPNEGTIKIVFKPNSTVNVGDQVQIKVNLTSPGKDFSQLFWLKIAEPQMEQAKPVQHVDVEEKIGLPQLVKVYANVPEGDDKMTWEKLSAAGDAEMGYSTVIHPLIEGDVLQTIYINMDSSVLKDYKSKLRSLEQHQIADRRYVSALYFHTLFLYAINKQRGYEVGKSDKDSNRTDVELTDYLKDIFSSNYAAFLLNFGTSELIEALG